MKQPTTTKNIITASFDLTRWIDAAPDAPESPPQPPRGEWAASLSTGLRKRYRRNWERPEDEQWKRRFQRIKDRLQNDHGIVAMIGNKGAGKTQLAAEVIKDLAPDTARYMRATALFRRIRLTFDKRSTETESDIERELSRTPLLVIDEIQERGESAWENQWLAEIIDIRYSDERPSILISNLTADEFKASLGDSIIDRMRQGGGMIEITGQSHRVHSSRG
jgi:DNA replication protein DnaC